ATNNPQGGTISSGLALAGNRTFTINNSTNAAADLTISGVISNGSGTRSLTKAGNGTLVLSNTNTYSGSTTLSAGVLRGTAAGAFGTGSLVVNGGTLELANNASTNFARPTTVGGNATITVDRTSSGAGITHTLGALSINGSTLSVNSGSNISANSAYGLTFGATTLTGGATFNVANNGTGVGTLTLGALSDAGTARTLTKTGTGTLNLSGAAGTWTTNNNVVISNGTLQVGVTNALGSSAASNVTVNATTAGTTASLATASSANQSIRSLTFGGAGATATSTNNVTIGSSSALTLGGNVTYDATNNPLGATISGSGTLALGSSTRTFTVGNSTSAANDLTISTNITGTGGLIKTGAGTLALSGSNNTFNGSANAGSGIVVSQGTLLGVGTTSVGGFKAFGDYSGVVAPTTVITVNSGATLAVQNTTPGSVAPAVDTTQLLTMSLSGTGADGNGALQSHGGRNTWLGNISLAGNTLIQNTVAGDNATLFLGAYAAPSPPTSVNLNGHTLSFSGAGDVYISNSIGVSSGDTGGLTIGLANTSASVTLAGVRNYHTGATNVNTGWLRLAVDSGNNANAAILNNLTIGTGSGAAGSAVVSNLFIEQIADNASVLIKKDGKFDLATHSVNETLSNLTLEGGHVTTGTGNLYLTGTLNVTGAFTSKIDGNVGLSNINGPARTFNVGSTSTLQMDARIFGGDYIKAGTGKMVVTSDNLTLGYTGKTTVSGGTLTLQHSGALGDTGGGSDTARTEVLSGATLQLEKVGTDIAVGAEKLVINGSGAGGLGALHSKTGANNSWGGYIVMGSDSTIKTDSGSLLHASAGVIGTGTSSVTPQTLTVGGAGHTKIGAIVDGAGGGFVAVNKIDSGILSLRGNSTFTGAIAVTAGTVQVIENNVLGSHVNAVDVSSNATFKIDGSGGTVSNTIGALTGSGLVSIVASSDTLVVDHSDANTFDGRLSGSGLFDKTGSGTFTFSSTANTSAFDFDGTVRLSEGTMEFAGGSAGNALTIANLTLLGDTTLYLNASYINVGTLLISGDTILDFGTGGASVLNATNIYIASGATLTVKNWTSEVDFLFATNSGYATSGGFRLNNSTGTLAIFNQIGAAPENHVHFENTNSADGSHTTWINNNYDGFTNWEIRPIPEPSTYGALLIAGSLGLLGYRRFRKSRSGSAAPARR
ncbi:MAG TPA: autotransporter-associated beta strand repeat-containing protein, partial [Opitutus sp.]|nr:autotransporter-associated beta strand repeat-containing protein [Opitutus sp.]